MTKKKIFKTIVCVLVVLTVIWNGFLGVALFNDNVRGKVFAEEFDIWVTYVRVTTANADDILGDGTVRYDIYNQTLTFENAVIESKNSIIYTAVDLNVNLIGENKFICTNEENGVGIYAADTYIYKDLTFFGDGSLTIELPNRCEEATGIKADDLMVNSNITVITPDCNYITNGIVCDSSMIVENNAKVTVKTGSATHAMGVRVRGDLLFEEGTSLNVSVKSGATETCEGLNVIGDLFMEKNTSLDISIDDEPTLNGECIRVNGLMDIGEGSKVTASAKNAHAIECYSTIKANEGAVISATSDKEDSDIFCSGAIINYGAEINGEIYAVGGISNIAEN